MKTPLIVGMALLLIVALVSLVPNAVMATQTIGTTTSRTTVSGNPATLSMTLNAGDTGVVLLLVNPTGVSRGGGTPTYGGVSMTQADTTRTSGEGRSVEMWYLVSGLPAAGSNNFSVPNSTGGSLYLQGNSFAATAGYTSELDVASGVVQTGTNPSHSVTTTVDGDILFAVINNDQNSWAPSAQTGTSLWSADDGAAGSAGQYFIDTTAGSQAMGWTFGSSANYALIVAAFKEVAPAGAPITSDTIIFD